MMRDTSRKRARRYAFALLAGTGLSLALAAAPPEGRGAAPLGSPGDPAQVTNATPIFHGDRVYLRAEANLYCIGTP